jgi:hypothetical protein
MRRTSGAILMVLSLLAIPAAHAGVDVREHRQRARIREGVRSGELTGREAARLRAEQTALRAEERSYRSTGGGLSPWERRDLRRDLNRGSRHIHRQNHDGQSR